MERRGPIDLLLLFITLILLTIGLIMVLSSSSYDSMLSYGDALYYFKRQLSFMVLGFFPGMFIMANIDPKWIRRLIFPAVLVCIVMLILVPFIGVEVNGSKRWLKLLGVRFAPAEIAKPIFIIFFAMFLTRLGKKKLQSLKGFFGALFVLAIFPGVIVGEDLGTAISIAGALVCMLIAAEIPWRYLIGTVVAGAAGVVAMIAIKPYRMKRIAVWLDPFSDPLASGYQAVQSLYALGSGGLFGVGLGASRQKLLHLPERHTDFIFSIIGEELGFVGALFVILLFILFIWRGFYIAIHIDDQTKSLTTFGLTAVIGIQAMMNIGVSVGFFPVTGITLPFISYGGTSLVFMLATVGYLLNMSRYRKR